MSQRDWKEQSDHKVIMNWRTVKYAEGDMVAVPLPSGGYCPILVARSGRPKPKVFICAFGQEIQNTEDIDVLDTVRKRVIMRACGNGYKIGSGDWPLIAHYNEFCRLDWPLPEYFYGPNHDGSQGQLEKYSDPDLRMVSLENVPLRNNDDQSAPCGLFGTGTLPVHLERKLRGISVWGFG